MLADTLKLVGAGLLIGVPVAIWAKTFAAGMIEGLPTSNRAPIAFSAVMMITVALLAAYVPARRAVRVQPVEALRHE